MSKNSKYNIQVNSDHYSFNSYVEQERWTSYYHQIKEIKSLSNILNKKKLKILEIGPGDGTVSTVLRNMRMNVKTMDIDSSLKPDYVSALPDLNLPKKVNFDCVLCCEVLEHINFSDVDKSLKNISKISNYLVISVPHASLSLSLTWKFIYFKTIKKLFSVDLNFRNIKFNGQHYWEIGYKNYSLGEFKKVINKSGFKIIKDFRITEHPYHHFFVLKTK